MKNIFSKFRSKDQKESSTNKAGPSVRHDSPLGVGAPSGSRPTSIISRRQSSHSVISPPSSTSRPTTPSTPLINSSEHLAGIMEDEPEISKRKDKGRSRSYGSRAEYLTVPLMNENRDDGKDDMEEREHHPKKVTFRSPAPTPTASLILDEIPSEMDEEVRPPLPPKQFQRSKTPSPTKKAFPPTSLAHTTKSRTSSRASSSSAFSPPLPSSSSSSSPRKKEKKLSIPPLSAFKVPYHSQNHHQQASSSESSARFSGNSSPTKSFLSDGRVSSGGNGGLLSPTPTTSSESSRLSEMSGRESVHSNRSYIPPPNTWSEMADQDLINNLGPGERQRQEILWEIVSSEERYVHDLVQLNETFCKPLLPISAIVPQLSLFDPMSTLSRTLSPSSSSQSPPLTPKEDDIGEFLPIAARYATTLSNRSRTSINGDFNSFTTLNSDKEPPSNGLYSGASARLNAYERLTNGRPSTLSPPLPPPKNKPSLASLNNVKCISAIQHRSLPPPPRNSSLPSNLRGINGNGNGTGSLTGRASSRSSYQTNHLNGMDSRVSSGSSLGLMGSRMDVPKLPESLEEVLKVLSTGILEGHLRLAAALRNRYEDEYPLVRSLADIFTAHSHILKEYATYILHLEAALSSIDSALNLAISNPPTAPKRFSRSSDLPPSPELRLGRVLLHLEEIAADKGEPGLLISLSKSFQRLLKYPLLFQNLLFNTDPSLMEYEKTLDMVDQVEKIVRGIEDEKASMEERLKTRDCWGRIEGLEKEKGLMVPKQGRLLISEMRLSSWEETLRAKEGEEANGTLRKGGMEKSKKSNRLSDILKHKDNSEKWIVKFTDVSLICVKTGVTHVPLSSSNKYDKEDEMDGKRTRGRKAQSVNPRNLYKFISIHQWHLKQKTETVEALVSMDESVYNQCTSAERSKQASTATSSRIPTIPASPVTPRKKPVASNITTPTPRYPNGKTSPFQTPTRMPIKTIDGSSPTRTPRAKSKNTDSIVSDRMSMMSFAFTGDDRLTPAKIKPRPSNSTNAKSNTASIGRNNGLKPPGSNTGITRRTSVNQIHGKAANEKFGNRMRLETETSYNNGDITIRARPNSSVAARRSLPPSMINQPFNTITSTPRAGLIGKGEVVGNMKGIEIGNGKVLNEVGGNANRLVIRKKEGDNESIASRRIVPKSTAGIRTGTPNGMMRGAATASPARGGKTGLSRGGKI